MSFNLSMDCSFLQRKMERKRMNSICAFRNRDGDGDGGRVQEWKVLETGRYSFQFRKVSLVIDMPEFPPDMTTAPKLQGFENRDSAYTVFLEV